MRVILLCGLTAIIVTIAGSWIAQAQAPAVPVTTESAAIVIEGAAVIFKVKGREQARIDDKGLHVRGDVVFTGMTIDSGTYPEPAGAP